MSEARWRLCLEIVANVVNLVSIVLAGRNSVHTWWTGIIGCVLFGTLFGVSQLYADTTLQLFFIATSIIGWVRWQRGESGAPLPIRRTPPRVLAMAGLAAAGVTFGYGALLHRFTNAYAPYIDSLVLAFSVVGQVLLMGRRLETWLFWLAVNTVSVPLYVSRGLNVTAVLYALFWANACVSFAYWRRSLAAQHARSRPVPA